MQNTTLRGRVVVVSVPVPAGFSCHPELHVILARGFAGFVTFVRSFQVCVFPGCAFDDKLFVVYEYMCEDV